MPLISIIIPVYNNEKYVARCLDSLIAQNFLDFEVLVINDGSKDDSEKIIRQYTEKDKRFHYFEQINQGVSAARNKGLDNAEGHYVLFLDGDDWLDPDVLERLFNAAEKDNLDCVSYMFRHVYEDGTPCKEEGKKDDLYMQFSSAKEISHFIEKNAMSIFFTSQRHLFLRSIIEHNHIRFAYGIKSGEDWLFVHMYSLFIRRCKILYSCCGYNYYKHSGSCLHTNTEPWDLYVFQYIKCYEYFQKYLITYNIKTGGYESAYQAWYFLLGFTEVNRRYPDKNNRRKVLHSAVLIRNMIGYILKYSPVRRKILAVIFLISSHLFSKIVRGK